MTQEEKSLLLTDLCARLLYSVKIQIVSSTLNTLYCKRYDAVLSKDNLFRAFKQDTIIRPYLRPISSMTEEEKIELSCLFGGIPDEDYIYKPYTDISYSMFGEVNDWLNEHYFDYRGLIEKGLALEAPEEMYNQTKE